MIVSRKLGRSEHRVSVLQSGQLLTRLRHSMTGLLLTSGFLL